jgi:hypothetical protein
MSKVANMYPDGRRGSNPIDIPKKKKTDRDVEDEDDRNDSLGELSKSTEVRKLPYRPFSQKRAYVVVMFAARTNSPKYVWGGGECAASQNVPLGSTSATITATLGSWT